LASKTNERMVNVLLRQPQIEFAVLVGSRVTGTARVDSDWDIALQWKPQIDWFTLLSHTETLRRELAEVMNIPADSIDLIDLRRANLAMRASVAEEGRPLTGQDSLAWAYFLQRTWRELEDFFGRNSMRLDLYQVETARIASEQNALLNQAKLILKQGRELSPLEQGGVLHALQILIENAIGKAKQLLKASDQVVPVSGYDAFRALANLGLIAHADLPSWNAIIGLRNRIVHDYMNIDISQVIALLQADKEQFVVNFLRQSFEVRNL
jgi:uncharacterized protein YutE (UPF0331/DUF86 family)/predicted nucleotidyltransferase